MVFFLTLAIYLVVFSAPAYAQDKPAEISGIATVLENIIKLLAPAATIAFLIMAIYGGYTFIRSRGEPKNVEQGRNILQYALIGAVLVVASWLILQLIKNLTGADVTTITIN